MATEILKIGCQRKVTGPMLLELLGPKETMDWVLMVLLR